MGILTLVEFHVTSLIKTRLPAGFKFHNLQHTRDVVAAVGEIVAFEDLNIQQWEDLMIAAWFHDTGYTVSVEKHEWHSAVLARKFLKGLMDPIRIRDICQLIDATRLECHPQLLTDLIIRDADTYHLSRSNYQHYMQRLRKEWHILLGKDYPDDCWLKLNLDFLTQHKYQTRYGQHELEKRKRNNIRMLEFQLIDSMLITN